MESINNSNSDSMNATRLFLQEVEGYPMIYPITICYLMPVIKCGRVIHVLWYVIGCIGNTLSMKIWTNPRMKRVNSSALYLVCITVCDVLYQSLHVFSYLKYFWGLASLGVPGLCQVWSVLNMIPQYASPLLVLGFTVERFISVLHPFKGERFSRHERAPREVTAVFVFVVILALPQAYLWKVDNRGFCELRSGASVVKIYSIWSFITEPAIFLVVPVVTLFLNLFLLRETRKSMSRNQTLTKMGGSEMRVHTSKARNYRPATVTLLCISFFRILTLLPVSITYTMQNLKEFGFGGYMSIEDMGHDKQWRSFFAYWSARVVIEAIGASHHALSVFIFYFSTKQYRFEVLRLYKNVRSLVEQKRGSPATAERYSSDMNYTCTLTQCPDTEVTKM